MRQVKAKSPHGFRRLGIRFAGQWTDYPEDRFTPEEWAVLKLEKAMVVQENEKTLDSGLRRNDGEGMAVRDVSPPPRPSPVEGDGVGPGPSRDKGKSRKLDPGMRLGDGKG